MEFKPLSSCACSLTVLVFEQFTVHVSFEDSQVLKVRSYPLPHGDLAMPIVLWIKYDVIILSLPGSLLTWVLACVPFPKQSSCVNSLLVQH